MLCRIDLDVITHELHFFKATAIVSIFDNRTLLQFSLDIVAEAEDPMPNPIPKPILASKCLLSIGHGVPEKGPHLQALNASNAACTRCKLEPVLWNMLLHSVIHLLMKGACFMTWHPCEAGHVMRHRKCRGFADLQTGKPEFQAPRCTTFKLQNKHG